MMRKQRVVIVKQAVLLILLILARKIHGFALPLDVDFIHQALVALQSTAAAAAAGTTANTAATVVSPSFLPPTAVAGVVGGDDLLFAAVNVMDAQQQRTQQQQQQEQQQPPPEANASATTAASSITASRPFFTPSSLFNFTLLNDKQQKKQELWTLQDIASILQGNTNAARGGRQSLSQTLSLTPQEQALFQLIMEVRRRFAPSTTIRVAGGWVRDKLLQRNAVGGERNKNVDIDFVLSDMAGSEFARLLYDYLIQQTTNNNNNDNQQNLNLNISLSSPTSSNTTTTTATAALKEYKDTASQHLQTASLRIGDDFQLDFCQMRLEKYNDQNSRVPSQTNMAQAVQDAFRRDLTINALYFNLNTNRVEDWTERGLQDLIRGNLATPTPEPKKALLQDPLRILRAIRFAAQLSFYLDPALLKAGRDVQVHVALQQKVSTTRMGNEMNGIFDSANPTRGIGLLLATNLAPIVFSVHSEYQQRLIRIKDNNKQVDVLYQDGYQLLFRTQTLASRIFSSMAQQQNPTATATPTPTRRTMSWNQDGRRYLWYAAFLKPLHDVAAAAAAAVDTSNNNISSRNRDNGRSLLGKRQRRQGSVINHVLVQQLGRPTRDVESIESIIQGANNMRILLERYKDMFMPMMTATLNSQVDENDDHDHDDPLLLLSSRNSSPIAAADLRLACYKVLKRIGPLWKESLILSLALSTNIPLAQAVLLFQNMVVLVEDRLRLDASLLFLDKNNKKRQHGNGGSVGATIMKPLLNGDEIQKLALGNLHGQAFRKIMQAQEEWQIRHCWDVDSDKFSVDNESSSSSSTSTSNEASKRKAALIDYLVQTFPEYC